MNRTVAALGASLCVLTASAQAQVSCNSYSGFLRQACQRVARVATDGTWDLYVTGYAWHIDGYGGERRKTLNQNAWGGGAGKHWTDADGNEDLLFAFAWMDSHDHVEPIAGYARQWFTSPVWGGLAVGGGFMAAITARSDVMHYVPFPLAAPVASIRYRRASIMGTFIPHLSSLNAGNLLFVTGRYEF
jgi:Antimicrobial peptide resistance and lipid A acylation protein PagP